MKKVLVAMSGGVDSSVAAYLLKEQGYEIAGVTMCLGVKREDAAACCGAEAINDARRVCDVIGIGHYVLDFSKEFDKDVVGYFIDEYAKGRTPNPCVNCNKYLKFGQLLAYAKSLGFDYLATGHYAKIISASGGNDFVLKKPKDRKKDQTYFLYCIKKEDLGKIIFPLADYTKEEVRAIAKKAKLSVAEKKESQDICFIPEGDYAAYLRYKIKLVPGDIVNLNGKVMGKHKGVVAYTIGQRQGLGISHKTPLYVIGIDVKNNRVVVGGKQDLLSSGLIADNVNLLVDRLPTAAAAKIRYSFKETMCDVFGENGIIKINFPHYQEAVTPGQSVVLYDGDIVLGGGVIREAIK
jgi:tRNA-specific 2-thiouridylase